MAWLPRFFGPGTCFSLDFLAGLDAAPRRPVSGDLSNHADSP